MNRHQNLTRDEAQYQTGNSNIYLPKVILLPHVQGFQSEGKHRKPKLGAPPYRRKAFRSSKD